MKTASDVSSLVLIKDNAEFLQMCETALERKEKRKAQEINTYLEKHVDLKLARMFSHGSKLLVRLGLRKKKPVDFSRTHYVNAIKNAYENDLFTCVGIEFWDVYEWTDPAAKPAWWDEKDNDAIYHIKRLSRHGANWWERVSEIRNVASHTNVIYCDLDLFHFIMDWSKGNG